MTTTFLRNTTAIYTPPQKKEPFRDRRSLKSTTDRGAISGKKQIRTGVCFGSNRKSRHTQVPSRCKYPSAQLPSDSFTIAVLWLLGTTKVKKKVPAHRTDHRFARHDLDRSGQIDPWSVWSSSHCLVGAVYSAWSTVGQVSWVGSVL